MVGASKIDHNTNDLERLQELFKKGLNNSEIARVYRTNSGESLSRIHISAIRSGKRWNPNNRSFLMKDEIGKLEQIYSMTNGVLISTKISQVISGNDLYYVYLTFKNRKPMLWGNVSLMENKPTRNELYEFHFKAVNELTTKD